MISPKTFSTLICMVGCVAAHSAARAANSKAVRDDSYASLGRGELQSVALRSDGTLMPTYEREPIGEAGVEIIWDTLREGKDSALAATGHEGRLVRIVDEKTSVTLAKLSDPELTAMVKMADGSVLVAGAPSGRLYRLDADDQLTTYTQLDAGFVWRMVRGDKDDVWIATGTEGKLFRLRPGEAEPRVDEIFDFESANLLDLWLDREGSMGPAGALYVAGQDPGWLYRFVPKGEKVEVVYNARAEEVRALEPYGDGLAMALNTERAPTPQALNLTLRMGGGAPVPGGAPPPPGGDNEKALSGAFTVAQQQNYGPPRSEVVVLKPSGFAHSLWGSPERPIHDLALSPDGRLLAAAGGQGRLFEIEDNGDHAIVADLREDYVLRMVQDDQGLLLATARNGLVVDLKPRRAREAVYLSHPLDAGSIVSWGSFYWHGQARGGQSVKAAFRVGNDGDAESELWSPWTKDQSVKSDEPAPLPAGPARFLQYRLTLSSKGQASEPVSMDYAELFYAPPNEAPRVLEIKVNSAAAPKKGGPGQGQKPGNGGKPPGGAPGAPPSPSGSGKGGAATAGGVAERSNTMGISVSWKVADPNSDQLRYGLYFKADDETAWKLIDDELMKNQLSLNIGGVADGRYRFRVEASDELANPPGEGLNDEMVSDQFVVDNTPPRFESPRIKVKGRRATIAFELVDDLSLISSVKVDIDNGDAYPLWPDDAIADERSEQYTFTSEEVEPGEYTATFNATDRQGNTAVHKSVFTIK